MKKANILTFRLIYGIFQNMFFFQYLEFFYGNRDIKPSIVLCNWYLEVCIGPK